MIPKSRMVKSVYLFCTDEQVNVISEFLKDETNQDFNVSLRPVIETDENGFIKMFRPTHRMSMGLLFFLQNLAVMQRMYYLDDILKKQGILK